MSLAFICWGMKVLVVTRRFAVVRSTTTISAVATSEEMIAGECLEIQNSTQAMVELQPPRSLTCLCTEWRSTALGDRPCLIHTVSAMDITTVHTLHEPEVLMQQLRTGFPNQVVKQPKQPKVVSDNGSHSCDVYQHRNTVMLRDSCCKRDLASITSRRAFHSRISLSVPSI